MITSFVDESGHYCKGDAGVYVLAAVLVHEEHAQDVRAALIAMCVGKSRRIHWRHETHARQRELARALCELPIAGVLAVHLHSTHTTSERARGKCLELLVDELVARTVDAIVFETRQENLNKTDRGRITGLRKSGRLSKHINVTWEVPSRERAELWAADILAGAYTWSFDTTVEHFEHLRSITVELSVDDE